MELDASGDLVVEIDGGEFAAKEFSVEVEEHIEHWPEEVGWVFSPDKYGGIYFPVVKNPHKTERVKLGQSVEGEILFGEGVTPETFIPDTWYTDGEGKLQSTDPDEDPMANEPMTFDITVPELGFELTTVYFETVAGGRDPWRFVAKDIRVLPDEEDA